MFYGYYGYNGLSWLLLLAAIVLATVAQIKVSSTYSKYSKVYSRSQRPAADVARQILASNGLGSIPIQQVEGNLTDHYDPRSKTLRLSRSVYGSPSVAALGVAAHEAGHAMQDAEGYLPLKIRNSLVPVAQFGSHASWVLIILGFFMGALGLVQLGIILFSIVVVFQIATLPVEFNASSRALAALEGGGYLDGGEIQQTKRVLSAAAFTYVAAVLVSLLQLLRLLLIFGGRRDFTSGSPCSL